MLALHKPQPILASATLNARQVLIQGKVRVISGEILERIVQELLFPSHFYAAISSFSLVSRQFHEIAVKTYFHTTQVRSMGRAAELTRIANIDKLVRHLICPIDVVSRGMFPIHSFLHLTGLETSCLADSSKSIHQKVLDLFPYLPQTLTTLRVTQLPHIGTEMLNAISDHVTGLVVLQLSVVDRLDAACCLVCLQTSWKGVMHSPVGPRFEDIEHMMKRYGASLAPLKHLRQLSLGIFTSNADVPIFHAKEHAAYTYSSSKPVCPEALRRYQDQMTDKDILDPSLTVSPPAQLYLPSNCTKCYKLHREATRKSEDTAARLLGKILPCLETIRLYSWFGKAEKEDRATGPRWVAMKLRRKAKQAADGDKGNAA